MPGTSPITAAPPPADASSGHAALDSHHSGQIQAITTVAVSLGQRGRAYPTNLPSASAGCGMRQAQQKCETNKAPSGRAANQIKRQQGRRTQRPRRQSHPLQRADTGENDGRPVSPTVKGCQPQHPAVSSSGTRTDAAQKDKAKATPSGDAVRVTHRSGQAQTTTTVVKPHGLKRRAICNTSPYRAWIHI